MKPDYKPYEQDGIMIHNICELQLSAETGHAYRVINELLINRPPSILTELKLFRKYARDLLRFVDQCDLLMKHSIEENLRYQDGGSEKHHKRWTDSEEEMLIELVCEDRFSLLQLSTMFGRTPSALKTKLSNLVGVKRLSQKVVGKLIGTVDGKETEADIDGILYKEV